ncbi:MAG: AmmeMemoRadiSam system protein B [Oxalobacteraceae bacterium]|nr:AmmeMemoRadiSam system protein B [Oxalobacteraceae bacterium]
MSTANSLTRNPALAGAFYPADPGTLRNMVGGMIEQANQFEVNPKVIVAPHAGYIYSGAIAASAYKPLLNRAKVITRVVMLGPPHRQPVKRFCLPSAKVFLTPLGEVPVDQEATEKLIDYPGVVIDDGPHAQEHCFETQLPFLQCIFERFSIVPILVGAASPSEVDALISKLWGGEETLVLVSSDLSHYLDYGQAQRIDEESRRAIELLRPDRLGDEQACGRHGLRGLLKRAGALDLRATTLDLRNSGDTGGNKNRDRVVGYGAWSFEYAAKARLSDRDRRQLGEVARLAITLGLKNGRMAKVDASTFSRPLQAMRACFVTLTLDGNLRGCIGSVTPHESLVTDVAANAYKAAFQDPRFPRLTQEEVSRLQLSVSILSHPRLMDVDNEVDAVKALHPDVDGIILQGQDAQGHLRRGLFLPQVWRQLPDPAQFLTSLKLKAGLSPTEWPVAAHLWRYRTETFH